MCFRQFRQLAINVRGSGVPQHQLCLLLKIVWGSFSVTLRWVICVQFVAKNVVMIALCAINVTCGYIENVLRSTSRHLITWQNHRLNSIAVVALLTLLVNSMSTTAWPGRLIFRFLTPEPNGVGEGVCGIGRVLRRRRRRDTMSVWRPFELRSPNLDQR